MSPAAGLAGRDPLLAIVRLILGAAMVFVLGVAATMVAGVPLIFAWRGKVIAQLAVQGAPGASGATIWAIVGLLLLSAGLAVLGFFFFRHLYRIVGSVGEGDPFVPVNAVRLRAMAWISVAVHVVAIPMAMLAHWLERFSKHAQFHVEFPLSGLFLALVLFILARVFREGTRMREELDGMV